MEDQVLYAFKKSETEEVRLSRRHYKGKAYLDLRVYFMSDGMTEFKPTKKGLTLSADLAPDLEKAFQEVATQVAKS